ncbi:MAG: hypothetical protein ACT4OY_05115 [Alphaproteobacteria bacterium]
MKKLALMTTAAAVMFAVPAIAGHDMYENRADGTYKLEVQNEPNTQIQTTTRTRTEMRPSTRQQYTLGNGQRIIVQGTEDNSAVYLANANGNWKYPAPKGTYLTTSGLTIVSDDGKWLRTEGPMETVYVDIDADNDGMADQVRTRTY